MPVELEKILRREANKHKDWSEERKNRYIYGTLNRLKKEGKIKWTPSRSKSKSKLEKVLKGE